jgi:hypothetical protein
MEDAVPLKCHTSRPMISAELQCAYNGVFFGLDSFEKYTASIQDIPFRSHVVPVKLEENDRHVIRELLEQTQHPDFDV